MEKILNSGKYIFPLSFLLYVGLMGLLLAFAKYVASDKRIIG
jgi:hypothetical protein